MWIMFDFSILGFFYTSFRILDSFFHTKYVLRQYLHGKHLSMIISHMFYSFHEKPNLDTYF